MTEAEIFARYRLRVGRFVPCVASLLAGVVVVTQVSASTASLARQEWAPAAHRTEPILSSHGFTMKPLRVITIVAQTGTPNDATTSTSRLGWFGVAMTHSRWYRALNAGFGGMGHNGTARELVLDTVPAVDAGSTVAGYQDIAFSAASRAGLPADPGSESLYLFYLDCDPSLKTSFHACSSGFHRPVDLSGARSGQASLFGPDDSVVFVTGNGPVATSDFDTMTRTASHEVIEAATNPHEMLATGFPGWYIPIEDPPWSGNPWSLLQDGTAGNDVIEVADMGRVFSQQIRLPFRCSARAGSSCQSGSPTDPESSFSFARIYSPRKARANGDPDVPPTPVPYYSVSTAADWYTVSSRAGTLTIPVTAWSTTRSAPWTLTASQLAGGAKCTISGLPAVVQNGTSVGIDVKLDFGPLPDVATGPTERNSWCIIELKSHRRGTEGAGATADTGGDASHSWIVGVYTTYHRTPTATLPKGPPYNK